MLSSVLEKTGDEAGAFREIAQAMQIDPKDPQTLVHQAQLYTRANRWVEAEATARRVVEMRPNYWLARTQLGVVYTAEGKYRDALGEFLAANTIAPQATLAANNAASVYAKLGKVKEAKTLLGSSLKARESPETNSAMASVMRTQGDAAEAVPFARRAVDLDPSDGLNWVELGDCYEAGDQRAGNGKSKQARDAYGQGATALREALAIDTRDGPLWVALALCMAKVGDAARAGEALAQADKLPTGDVDTLLLRARTLAVLGRRDEARKVLSGLRPDSQFEVASTRDLQGIQAG